MRRTELIIEEAAHETKTERTYLNRIVTPCNNVYYVVIRLSPEEVRQDFHDTFEQARRQYNEYVPENELLPFVCE